jgi:trimeric autotransporter adhesin
MESVMNEQFGTVDQDSEIEVQHEAKTTTCLLMERGSCSPRVAVALSALAGVRWLQNILNNLRRRMVRRGMQEKRFVTKEKIMKKFRYPPSALIIVLLSSLLNAQQTSLTTTSTVIVPRLVNYSGHLSGAPSKSVAGMTFSIYREQEGGAPLWMETQNVTVDAKGNYTAQLGATKSEGLPLELFNTSESRWLGIRVNGGEEQPRVLLLSVPYALKAADAETIGGLPPSAFVLAAPPNGNTASPAGEIASVIPSTTPPPTSGTGTTDFIALWLNSTGSLGNSVLFQTGTGSTAKVGINTTTPVTTMDVNGSETVRGNLVLPTTGSATTTAGKNSQPTTFTASAFSSATNTAVTQSFRWQAEPVSNNTTSASGSLNLLFGRGASAPSETGLKVGSDGHITFASGQTFPGTGTVKSVGLSAPSSDFTVSGSPVTGSGTLKLSWIAPPTSASQADTIVRRDGSGSFTAGTINASAVNANTSIVGGVAVSGISGTSAGVVGQSTSNAGVWGTSNTGDGVFAQSGSASAYAVYGQNMAVNGIGIYGSTTGSTGTGVLGFGNIGVHGVSASIDGSGAGVFAEGRPGAPGLYAQSTDSAPAVNANNVGSGTGILAGSVTGFAGWFNGNVQIDGNLSKQSGSFKIDHPLDPANKYLYHSFVESPDMMNIYNGNVTTDAAGGALVTLPEWFETLNRDFRYQLTVMGQFAQAIVASKVTNHRFSIKTDKPSVEVSWQVTGIRHDAWADAHRIPVEEEKSAKERGTYLSPELFGAPEEKGVLWVRDPQAMKQWKEARKKLASTAQKEGPIKQ